MKNKNRLSAGAARMLRQTAVVSAVFAALAMPAAAANDDIVGTWRGHGTAVDANGENHTVRCLITFSDRSDGAVGLAGRCSTVAEAAEGTGRLTRRGRGRYAGTVEGLTYSAQGSIAVKVDGDELDVTVSGSEGQLAMPMVKVSN